MGLTALGLFSFAMVGTETGILTIISILIMLGFGFALFSSPNMSAIMGSVDKKFYGVASGTVPTMRLLGQMISMAIAMVVFAVFIGRVEINPSNYELFLKSVKFSFVIFTVFCMVGIFFSCTRGEMRSAAEK